MDSLRPFTIANHTLPDVRFLCDLRSPPDLNDPTLIAHIYAMEWKSLGDLHMGRGPTKEICGSGTQTWQHTNSRKLHSLQAPSEFWLMGPEWRLPSLATGKVSV